MDFSPCTPTVMHVDLNSCFATIEQQANPFLRGKPVAVAAYVEDRGCILAASVEAKRLGIKTGMRVRDGKFLCPQLVVLPPDPNKYRFVNRQLLKVLQSYSPEVSVESIDEMVMDVGWMVVGVTPLRPPLLKLNAMVEIAQEIKQRIKSEIGEWITVSIGIAPNRYLAKVASGLHKPNGLDLITQETIASIFAKLKLEDLCGIKTANANRLRLSGIYTPLAMLSADARTLERAFHSIVGYHWWLRLHGYEDGSMYKTFKDQAAFAKGFGEPQQKSFGQSYALGRSYTPQEPGLHQILAQLVMKMGRRLREAGASARSIGVSLLFTDYTHWGARVTHTTTFYADSDLYQRAKDMLVHAPKKPVRICAVYCFNLRYDLYRQESLLPEDQRKKHLTQALDAVHDRWGDFVVMPGRMLHMEPASTRERGRVQRGEHKVLDRIAFGSPR